MVRHDGLVKVLDFGVARRTVIDPPAQLPGRARLPRQRRAHRGHPRVHGARADPRRGDRRARRPVLVGGPRPRAAHGTAPLALGPGSGRLHRRHRLRRSPAAGRARPRRAPARRRRRPPRPRQDPGAALPHHARRRGRAGSLRPRVVEHGRGRRAAPARLHRPPGDRGTGPRPRFEGRCRPVRGNVHGGDRAPRRGAARGRAGEPESAIFGGRRGLAPDRERFGRAGGPGSVCSGGVGGFPRSSKRDPPRRAPVLRSLPGTRCLPRAAARRSLRRDRPSIPCLRLPSPRRAHREPACGPPSWSRRCRRAARRRWPFGSGFHEPDFEAPINLEAHLARIPVEATCKGLFLLDILHHASRLASEQEVFRVAQVPERRYIGFRDYPVAESLKLVVAARARPLPPLPAGRGAAAGGADRVRRAARDPRRARRLRRPRPRRGYSCSWPRRRRSGSSSAPPTSPPRSRRC